MQDMSDFLDIDHSAEDNTDLNCKNKGLQCSCIGWFDLDSVPELSNQYIRLMRHRTDNSLDTLNRILHNFLLYSPCMCTGCSGRDCGQSIIDTHQYRATMFYSGNLRSERVLCCKCSHLNFLFFI